MSYANSTKHLGWAVEFEVYTSRIKVLKCVHVSAPINNIDANVVHCHIKIDYSVTCVNIFLS
jgi:hypothetical protein